METEEHGNGAEEAGQGRSRPSYFPDLLSIELWQPYGYFRVTQPGLKHYVFYENNDLELFGSSVKRIIVLIEANVSLEQLTRKPLPSKQRTAAQPEAASSPLVTRLSRARTTGPAMGRLSWCPGVSSRCAGLTNPPSCPNNGGCTEGFVVGVSESHAAVPVDSRDMPGYPACAQTHRNGGDCKVS